jgi:hypothetical protein
MFCLDQPGEMFKGSVIGGLSIFWKTAGRKLPTFQVIADAVAAYAFSGARVIATVAMCEVLFFFAFHIESSSLFSPVLFKNAGSRFALRESMIGFCACQSGNILAWSGILMLNKRFLSVPAPLRD